MAFQLTINNVDYTAPMDLHSVNVRESLQVRGFSMSFQILIQNQDRAKPLAGQFVKFMRDGIKEFAGRIASVTEIPAGSHLNYWYAVECVDSSTDYDSQLINTVFGAQDVADIVRVVTGIVGRGFTSHNVVDGPTVNEQKIDFEPPTSVIQKLADSVGFTWYIDYNRDINFFHILDRPAPIPLISVDTDTKTYSDLEISETWEQVKNRIYLTGAQAKSTNGQNEPFESDGSQKFYPLGYQPFDFDSIEVIVDGVQRNILKDGIDGRAGDGLGGPNDVYICIDNWGVRFPDGNAGANAPGAGADIDINYNYAYEPTVIVEDPVSIAEMAARENTPDAPSNGVHELRFDIPDLRVTTEDSIVAYGQLLLLRYATIPYEINFNTLVQGWHVGQSIQVTSAASRRNFDRIFYVRGVTKSIRAVSNGQGQDVPQLQYKITAGSNPLPG